MLQFSPAGLVQPMWRQALVVRLPKTAIYQIKSPGTLYVGMVRDVDLLFNQPAFTSCATLIVCFIDALAAGTGKASKPKFLAFMKKYFPVLCSELAAAVPGKAGAVTFYEQFRNGLAHLRGPKSGYALARETETGEKYAEVFDVDGRSQYVGVNIDRLHTDFLGELTHHGLFRRLAFFDLAAGKLPETRELLALGPLRDQHASVRIDQRAGGDKQQWLLCFAHPGGRRRSDRPLL